MRNRWIHDNDEFIRLVIRSNLLAPADAARLVNEFKSDYAPVARHRDTITSLCTFLIEQGVLTSWQCEKLRQGQFRGFLLDDYKLVDRLGCDDMGTAYLAENTTTGKVVVVMVSPPSVTSPDRIEYRVDEIGG